MKSIYLSDLEKTRQPLAQKAEEPCLVCEESPAGDAAAKTIETPSAPGGRIRALFPLCPQCKAKENIERILEELIVGAWEVQAEEAAEKHP